ncbi:DNA alkylation repair protein [Rhodovulum adriaticum]|uniref:3-methyladenine DNA glycosylase AlkD n=1 Tax=Rhodovulum adriaticum TaxID=35804 RepID=A0A4R2NX82_RHOAD|nr:DNA alkylation repair protein [Rhodovulum adriaticum]MBK1636260.1 DNA alkylation repair protein [Rhodovulum adriaticum]TCP26258.1 3-methyladenine DNA glycosylase AlkD [Rhodovulum adriaticum]
MTPEAALAALRAHADAAKAADMAAYHKVPRAYLGVANPVIDDLARDWRQTLALDARLALAAGLWRTDIHEARIAAAKLLTQARIRPTDAEAWHLLAGWVPDFDGWAIADAVSIAGQKRLVADPARLDELADWTTSPHMWTRRATLVMTLPWAKMVHPKPADLEVRERVLGWAAGYVPERDWFMQKAVAWWLRDLSKRDPDRVRTFLAEHGDRMKPFARKEAARLMG